jgi:hypothetical protein
VGTDGHDVGDVGGQGGGQSGHVVALDDVDVSSALGLLAAGVRGVGHQRAVGRQVDVHGASAGVRKTRFRFPVTRSP